MVLQLGVSLSWRYTDPAPPPPTQKCPFLKIDFLDVSDDFKQKKNYGWKIFWIHFYFYFYFILFYFIFIFFVVSL